LIPLDSAHGNLTEELVIREGIPELSGINKQNDVKTINSRYKEPNPFFPALSEITLGITFTVSD
jgi:hypothetical protein